MARPKGGKRQQPAASGRKRKAKDDLFQGEEEDKQVFLESDDEGRAESEEEEPEHEETAEEKRLRLAKIYLRQVRAIEEAERDVDAESDEGGSGSDGEGAGAGLHGAVSDRLRQEALESMGALHRKLAHRLQLPPLPLVAAYSRPSSSGSGAGSARLLRGHRLPVTAVALTADDRTAFSTSKDGELLRWDVETGARERLDLVALGEETTTGTPADWVKRGPRTSGRRSLLAAAVSSDGRYLAVGGGDKKVHVLDARSKQYIRGFPGHKDAVTALAFRDGTHELYSASLDRSVKQWSLDDQAYVDTLFGHQAEVLGLDVGRQERAVTAAADRTCRVWKIPEESQLIFRGHTMTIGCCRYVTGSEWVTGDDGSNLCLWSSTKKKPAFTLRGAHFDPAADGEEAEGAGSVGSDVAGWIGSVAACKGSDIVASGAGDGVIRLWQLADKGRAGARTLQPLGGVPARGFVNSLQLARSGRFLVAGLGQEPRLGRWLRDPAARNGLLIHPLPLGGE